MTSQTTYEVKYDTAGNVVKKAEANTDKHLYDDTNKIKQTRHYGSDGRAEYDIDYHHPGKKHKFPHKHNWNWENGTPKRSGSIDIF